MKEEGGGHEEMEGRVEEGAREKRESE